MQLPAKNWPMRWLRNFLCESREGILHSAAETAQPTGALKVDALICGGIGGGAQMALSDVGIRLYGGVSGNADAVAEALVAGKLDFNPNVRCDHHDHHGEGHSCGSHGCGHHSCD